MIFGDYLKRNPNYPRLEGTNVNIAADELVWPAHETPGVTSGGQPARELHDGRLFKFTAACGPWIYRGDLLPDLYGNAFIAEPVGNLVQRKVLTAENGTLIGRNPYDRADFIASTDERFRPVNFGTGPDGALYVVDMYRGIVEHHSLISAYLREEIKSHQLEGPYDYGRIYRVVPIDKPAPRVAQIGTLTSAQWVAHLEDANAWWRETAQQLLVERHEAATVPAIRRIATSSTRPLGRVQALWTLEGVGALDRASVMGALSDKEPVVRVAALRLSERLFKDAAGRADLLARALALDERPGARSAVAGGAHATAKPTTRRRTSRWPRPYGRSRAIGFCVTACTAVSRIESFRSSSDSSPMPRGRPPTPRPTRSSPASRRACSARGRCPRSNGSSRSRPRNRPRRPRGRRRSSTASSPPPQDRARRAGPSSSRKSRMAGPALLNNADAKAALEKSTGTAPSTNDLVLWPGKPGVAPAVAPPPLTAEELARFNAGKTVYATICASCHLPDGRGQDGLAPPLLDSDWILGSPQASVRIIMYGLSGAIGVSGRNFIGEMPGLGALTDDQIASVLTYLRREWGHTAAPVDPEVVKSIRTATAGRVNPWGWRELNPYRQ